MLSFCSCSRYGSWPSPSATRPCIASLLLPQARTCCGPSRPSAAHGASSTHSPTRPCVPRRVVWHWVRRTGRTRHNCGRSTSTATAPTTSSPPTIPSGLTRSATPSRPQNRPWRSCWASMRPRCRSSNRSGRTSVSSPSTSYPVPLPSCPMLPSRRCWPIRLTMPLPGRNPRAASTSCLTASGSSASRQNHPQDATRV